MRQLLFFIMICFCPFSVVFEASDLAKNIVLFYSKKHYFAQCTEASRTWSPAQASFGAGSLPETAVLVLNPAVGAGSSRGDTSPVRIIVGSQVFLQCISLYTFIILKRTCKGIVLRSAYLSVFPSIGACRGTLFLPTGCGLEACHLHQSATVCVSTKSAIAKK